MKRISIIHLAITRRRNLALLAAGFIIVVDQLSKQLVESTLPLFRSWTPAPSIAPNFRISHISNTGASFGLFPAYSELFAWAAFIVSLGIIYYNYILPDSQKGLRLALALQLGGAVGNLADRLRIGHVTDFIDIGPWVLNFADAAIVMGAFILAGVMWQETKNYVPAPVQTTGLLDQAPVSDE